MFSHLNSRRLLLVLFCDVFWDEIDPMDTRDLKIKLLIIHAARYKKHPENRALKLETGQIP